MSRKKLVSLTELPNRLDSYSIVIASSSQIDYRRIPHATTV